jgi:hypothetical protein
MTTNKCKKCGCDDSFMVSPAPCPTPVGCPTPQPCSEIFDAQCVRYTGLPLSCAVAQTFNASPNPNPVPTGPIVNTNDTVAEALESIVDYICNNTPAPGYTYEIGQYVESRGGVIFHRYKDGGQENYLVVSINNISTSSVWSNINNIAIGATAQSTWDGLSNSNAIDGQPGETSSAAQLCLAYSVGTITDWYLPAIDELSLLWHNRFNVNRTLSGNSSFGTISGATQLLYNGYWSSTEFDLNQAFYFYFSNGASYPEGKGFSYYVRAVRKFSI